MRKVEKYEICPNCGPWKEEDPRMLREQCRVGDVAFQNLFCWFANKPIPDWAKDMKNVYRLLEEIKGLKADIVDLKAQVDDLEDINRSLEKNLNRAWEGA